MLYGQLLVGLGLAVGAAALPKSYLPKSYLHKNSPQPERVAAVREAFLHTWDGYSEHAFPNDNLHPLSNSFDNNRNGWGVTAVDTLSAAILLEERWIVDQILKHVTTIDFTTTAVVEEEISVFETNIRYLGGLISAYDLLKGPYRLLAENQTLVDACLEQAVVLADQLAVAFQTPSGIPDPTIMLNPTPRLSGAQENNIAEFGTLILEWTRLSDLTGDKKYYDLAAKAESYALAPSPATSEPFPGLVGTFVDINTGEFVDANGGWGAYTDSFYEYLIKMYVYDPDEFASYKDRWVSAAESTIQYLSSVPTTREDLLYVGFYEGTNKIPESQHLASFAAGNFILGGIVLNEPRYADYGLKLAESYFETYVHTETGIGPEIFRWVDSELPANGTNNPLPTGADAAFYETAGTWGTSRSYVLRPETIESLYHAYRYTRDPKYQDMAWAAFRAINATARAGSAYVSVGDVNAPGGGELRDNMESFWLAETLKYLYLIFSDAGVVNIHPEDKMDWVFNTEAHPIQVRKPFDDKMRWSWKHAWKPESFYEKQRLGWPYTFPDKRRTTD